METLLTVEQYARRAQLHPDSVRRQLQRGVLRGIKKGRGWRIPASALWEDTPSQARASEWQQAAQRMAGVYEQSVASGGELTAITTAPGDFYGPDSGAESRDT